MSACVGTVVAPPWGRAANHFAIRSAAISKKAKFASMVGANGMVVVYAFLLVPGRSQFGASVWLRK